MGHTGKRSPLMGLELTAEVMLSTEAAEIQQARREIGRQLSEAILGGPVELVDTEEGPAVLNTDTGELVEDRSAAFAAMLCMAANPTNHAAGILDDGHGGVFHGGMALWRPSLRIDPNWMEAMRRRSRARARQAFRRIMDGLTPEERMARRNGWRQRLTLKMVTLTMPHHAGTDTLSEVKRLNLAFERMKKRSWWRERVAGGVKGVEDALDADGPHVHAHLLLLSSYMDHAELCEEWRECLDRATMEVYGFGLAEDCRPVVDVRKVRKKGRPAEESVTLDDALNEVTKYITKPSEFLASKDGRRIPREALIELCEVERWPRMFELLGRCREAAKGKRRPSNLEVAAQAALDSIHRAYSTGELPKLPEWIGWEMVEGWDHETDGPEEKRKLVVQALKEREKKKPKRQRPPSWRELLGTISLGEWLSIMVERFRRGRKFRIRQIMEANPSAYLVTFKGKTLGCTPEIEGLAY